MNSLSPSFVESLIETIYDERRVLLKQEHDDYPDMRAAAYDLRRLTGMTQDQIAARLGMMVNQFALIEKRGHPIDMPDIVKMKAIAWEYSLFKLYSWFERQSYLFRAELKTRRRKRV